MLLITLASIDLTSRVIMFETRSDVLETVAKSFGKTTEQLDEDVKTLKEWIETQKHLPEMMEEEKIRNFLLFNKCNIDKTKHKIDMYYTMRTNVRHIFGNSNDKSESLKKVHEAVYCCALPQLTEDLCRVFVLKVRKSELMADLHPYQVLATAVNVQEIRLKEDITAGDIFIIDNADMCFRYILKCTPRVVYYHIQIYQNLFSSRLKAAYMVNTPLYMEKIIALAKLFMKPKLFERVRVSKDTAILKTEIPENILPKEYGGKGSSLEDLKVQLEAKFCEYQDRFDELDTLTVNESLRPKKTTTKRWF